ncbi:hypothetical protein Tco_1081357 [Tanacetum coccineum]|uniref:Uncharacterized protein n=1 Tax=Tanacetum coccineum TaxID=301880 RepID=A0ABQ5HZE4_9ASTR
MVDEQQDDQQQQQNMLDALLVLIDDRVKIGLSNFRIALEKSQPDIIYIGTLMTMINKCLTRKATAYDRPRVPMLYREWSQVRMLTLLNLSRRISGSKLIQGKTTNKRRSYYLLLDSQSSLSNTFSPGTTTYPQHVIKVDATLGNLKFTNKGAKDLVFGMPIPMVMLKDDIKNT